MLRKSGGRDQPTLGPQTPMKVLVWNCQGVVSTLTIPHLREACNLLSPNMLFLSEMKNRERYMDRVREKLNFENSCVVESMNRSGGMALMWKDEVKIIKILKIAFTIEAHVEDFETKTT